MKPFSDCASRRKNPTSTVAQYEPVLDEEAFQQLLAAAYVLQEHTKSPPGIEAQWDRPKSIHDSLIESPRVEPIRIPPVTPVDEQTQIGRADETQILSQGWQIRIILSFHFKRMGRRTKASALPVLILFIIVGFLLSMPWRHYPADIVAEAPSKTAPFAGLLKLDTTIRPKSQATSDNTQTDSPSLKSRHLRVTDSATASVLEP